MKKTVLMMVFGILAAGAWASADNLVYSFKPNPADAYADGTPVLAGERYALVWLAAGSSGVTIAADGTVTDPTQGTIVCARRSLGKGEKFTFQVDAKVKDALAANGGSWAVYLLDTRVYGADGSVALAKVTGGKVAAVNAAVRVEETVVEAGTSGMQCQVLKSVKTASQATSVTAVPADVSQPKITAISVVDGEARVKVADTVPYLQYNLAAGERPDAVAGKQAKSPRNGATGAEIELVAPVSESGAAFFQVNRN